METAPLCWRWESQAEKRGELGNATGPRTPHGRLRRLAPLVFLVGLLAGCRTGQVFPDPAGPRFAGGEPPYAGRPAPGPDTLTVASFNLRWGQEVDSALAVLRAEPRLASADILLLQEMDEAGTRRIAEELGLAFVYYPAIYRPATGRNFGNAVLSRWPIVEDAKLVLPHRAIFAWTQRTATRASIRIGSTLVQVYSLHLATPVNLALRDRRNQLRAVLSDAARHPHVIIGGDLNSGSVGGMVAERGYAWPTRYGPRTVFFGRWDHIFFKGLTPLEEGSSGTVADVRGASDHKPVWAVGVLR